MISALNRFRPARSVFVWLAVLAGLLVFLEPTDWEWRIGGLSVDQWIQDRFYLGDKAWLLDGEAEPWRLLFYNGPKILIMVFAATMGLCAFVPARLWTSRGLDGQWFADRRTTLFLVAVLALVPLGCNRLKAVTNIYCPYENTRYGGYAPYVRIWESYPEEFKKRQTATHDRGRGFPAGHASGGFALMALAYAARSRRWRIAGVMLGVFAGWWMGVYQMLKGAHYLNHTLVTWCLAWLGVILLARLFRPVGWREETVAAA